MAAKAVRFITAATSLTLHSRLQLLHRHHSIVSIPTNPTNTTTTPTLSVQIMSWSCKKCTFLNPPSSQKPTCQICLSSSSPPPSSPPPPSSSSSTATWPCKACTFLNTYNHSNCQVCDTRAPISAFEDLSDPDSPVGSVFLPLQRCKRRRPEEDDDPVEVVQPSDKKKTFSGFSGSNVTRLSGSSEKGTNLSGFSGFNASRSVKASEKAVNLSGGTSSGSSAAGDNVLKILSYNVWFAEDLEVHKRMKAIGDLIRQHSPDVICFQEVTPGIYDIFRQSSWWKTYQCSVSSQKAGLKAYFCMQLSKLQVKSFSCEPFGYSAMGRELCVVEVEVQRDKHLVVATSHLESPCPGPPKWDQMYSKERVDQAKEAVDFLKKNKNVVFCGDMNWDDKLDGQFPLADKWIDVWEEIRPDEDGWTYDTKANKMLTANRKLQKRLDRFVCILHDFRVSKIEMIGTDAIPGVSYIKEKKVKTEIKKLELPVLPSDHFGLLLTICSQ